MSYIKTITIDDKEYYYDDKRKKFVLIEVTVLEDNEVPVDVYKAAVELLVEERGK